MYAALAHYFDHRDEIDKRMSRDRAFVDALRAAMLSKRQEIR